jgi:hypothetical protein
MNKPTFGLKTFWKGYRVGEWKNSLERKLSTTSVANSATGTVQQCCIGHLFAAALQPVRAVAILGDLKCDTEDFFPTC